MFGIAKRGFGLLKKSKKGINPKKRLETFKKASQKADRDQTIKKAKKLIKKSKAAIQKRLMTPAPITPVGAGKKWVGRINPDGTHVRPKKSVGGNIKKDPFILPRKAESQAEKWDRRKKYKKLSQK
jgi:hypothetical protein